MATRRTEASDARRRRTGDPHPARRPDSYAFLSTRPLHVLVFLLPLVIAYEIGSIVWLSDPDTGTQQQILAQALLSEFFRLFGVGGLYLPGIALVAVLLIWQFLVRDPWRVKPLVLLGMLLESALWMLPLLVLAQMVSIAAASGAAVALAESTTEVLRAMPWQARATIAVGAGLYEELLFRMVAIALVHFVVVDLLGVKDTPGRVIAIAVSALAFALYHSDLSGFAFFLLAGLFFGAVYVWRGFGVVVATHVMYDMVALLAVPPGG